MSERLNIKNLVIEPQRRPERLFDPERDISPSQWNSSKAKRESYAQQNQWYDFASLASFETILGRKPDVTPSQWDTLKAQRESFAQQNNWYNFALLASSEAILGHKPDVTPLQWDSIKAQRESYAQQSHWYNFARLASYEAILAADEVRIPPGGGLELVWKKDTHQTETPALPEQRKF